MGFKKDKKIKIIIFNFLMVVFTIPSVVLVEGLIKRNAERGVLILFFLFIFLIGSFLFFKFIFKKMNLTMQGELRFDFGGWLSNTVDWFLVTLIIWGWGFRFCEIDSVVDCFIVSGLFVYYMFSFLLFSKTLGMKIFGLKLENDREDKSKNFYLTRVLLLSNGVFVIHAWIIGLILFLGWAENYWKNESSLIDKVSKTRLMPSV